MGLLPFYHIYGLAVLVFSLPIHRARVVTLPSFEPTSFLSAIQRYKMTNLHLVPPLAIFLAKHPLVDNYDLSSVRTLISGAAPLGKDTEAALSKRTGIFDIRQAYGLSEASPMITMAPKGTKIRLLKKTKQRKTDNEPTSCVYQITSVSQS